MKIKFQTINDQELEFENPVSININKSSDAPADDIFIILPINTNIPELKSLELISNQEVVFQGNIDEQIILFDSIGAFLKISARSFACLLLDNEACPQTYVWPSLDVIFKQNLKPYGFTKILGNKRAFAIDFVINKGMSEWNVLENFCSSYLNVIPIIESGKIINATGISINSEFIFSNMGQGDCYSSLSFSTNRCEDISKIYIKTNQETSYQTEIKNQDAVARGVNIKRYINASESIQAPAILAQNMYKQAQQKANKIIITVPSCVNISIGDKAKIQDFTFGQINNLITQKVKYKLDSSGEKTIITFFKED